MHVILQYDRPEFTKQIKDLAFISTSLFEDTLYYLKREDVCGFIIENKVYFVEVNMLPYNLRYVEAEHALKI
jgi:hypothetical protein